MEMLDQMNSAVTGFSHVCPCQETLEGFNLMIIRFDDLCGSGISTKVCCWK